MQQAIITGATGFIGSRLARFLSANNIMVYALGRKTLDEISPNRIIENDYLKYIQIDSANILDLRAIIDKDKLDDCVFFNFAWAGSKGLSDLDVGAQLNNAIYAVNAYEVADYFKCKKFVHVGTMEEAFADEYLNMNHHKNNEYNRHVIYSIAKKTARNLLKSVRHKYKTELIIVSKSHIMGPNDDRDSLLRVALRKFIHNEVLEFTSGLQNFDVVSITDCVRAFKLIGEKGKDNAEYWVGSCDPRTLKEYIERMIYLYDPNYPLHFGKISYCDVKLKLETFSPALLNKDTGFTCKQTFEDAVREMYEYLKNGLIIENNKII